MATNQGFKSLVLDPRRMDARFVAHWLRDQTSYLQSLGNGATFKELSKATTAQIVIPVPPVAEQRRIAAILDQADTLLAQRQRSLHLLDDAIQSVFLHMFGQPAANSKGLPTARLGSVAQVVTGNTPSRSEMANYGSGIEWIKSDNLGRSLYAARSAEQLSVQGERKARVAEADAVLMTCIAGSPSSIGNCSLAGRRVAFNQQINAVTSSHMQPRFLLAQLRAMKSEVLGLSSGGMKGMVTKSRLQSLEVVVPTPGVQDDFVARASQLDRQLELSRRSHVELNAAQAALQELAFAGRL